MRCEQCQHPNRDERRFCAACGAPMTTRCGACGFANQADEHYCGGCGAQLGGVAASGERRQVAVLFADLSDYTALSESVDPEVLHELLQRYYGAVDGVVARFGGTVDKHIGDSVMALFGAPVAHHDDCERAVRAAVDIHREVEALGAWDAVELRVHIGVAVGEVMASGAGSRHHRAYTVIGRSVNLAARLQHVARRGETVVSEDVRRATSAVAEFDELGEVALKGIERPVAAWRLARVRERRMRAERPLVGRGAELDRVAVLLDCAAEGGLGAAVHLRGEPGVGKTRMVQAIQQLAEERGFRACAGQVLDFGAERGGGAVETLVARLLGVGPASPLDAREDAAAAFFAARPGLARRAAFLHDLLGLPPPREQRATYEDMSSEARARGRLETLAALVEAASTRPLLLVIEDVHWADDVTLEQVAALQQASSRTAAVLVTTSRVDRDPMAGRGDLAATIDLGPLSPEESLLLAEQVAPGLGEAARRCVERAGGNPLFLVQLLVDGVARDEAAIPGTVQSLILARMDRLPPADRAALQAASVAGQRFALDLMRHLTGVPDYDCAALVAHRLVDADGAGYRFQHALVQEGVYSSLTAQRRRELHRAAAAYWAPIDPVLRARHLDRAEDPGAALAFLEAAEARVAASDLREASVLLERGLALARQAEDVRRIAMALGEVRLRAGDALRARDAYERALDASDQELETCRARIGLAAAHRLLSIYEPALEFLRQAEPIALRHGLDRELSEIHYLRGGLLFALGDGEGCRREHGIALDHATRAGLLEWRARALSGLADAAFATGDLHAAARSYGEATTLCETGGLERIAAINRIMQGNCIAQARMDFREAHALVDRGMAACERLGDEATAAIALTIRAFLYDLQGRTDELAACAERAVAELRRLSIGRFEPEALCLLALARHRLGQGEEAAALGREAAAAARASAMDFCGPMVLAALSCVAPSQQEREEALREGERILTGNHTAYNHLSFAGRALEGALERGDRALAGRCARLLTACIERYGDLRYWSFIMRRAHAAASGDAAARAEVAALAAAHGIALPPV